MKWLLGMKWRRATGEGVNGMLLDRNELRT